MFTPEILDVLFGFLPAQGPIVNYGNTCTAWARQWDNLLFDNLQAALDELICALQIAHTWRRDAAARGQCCPSDQRAPTWDSARYCPATEMFPLLATAAQLNLDLQSSSILLHTGRIDRSMVLMENFVLHEQNRIYDLMNQDYEDATRGQALPGHLECPYHGLWRLHQAARDKAHCIRLHLPAQCQRTHLSTIMDELEQLYQAATKITHQLYRVQIRIPIP